MQNWNFGNYLYKIILIALIAVTLIYFISKENAEKKVAEQNNDNNNVNQQINNLYDDVRKALNNLSLSSIGDQLSNLLKKVEDMNSESAKSRQAQDSLNQEIIQLKNEIKNKEVSIDAVKIFDLKKPLEPAEIYEPIKCRKSLEIIVMTTLCVYNSENDIGVSHAIWEKGVWEQGIMTSYMNYLDKNPDWLVLDVGAQVGQYSLYAAKMGRKVLAVEPFQDSIYRIHKASKTENIGGQITLIKNAISNKRGEIKMLQPKDQNIGGQGLMRHRDKVISKSDIKEDDPNFKYYVETILFDDILPYLPLNNDGVKYKKAIMKLDIEGFEPYAFQHASKLFDTLDIQIVMMEWEIIRGQKETFVESEQLLNFFYSRNYTSYTHSDTLLDPKKWNTWPIDIVWKKK